MITDDSDSVENAVEDETLSAVGDETLSAVGDEMLSATEDDTLYAIEDNASNPEDPVTEPNESSAKCELIFAVYMLTYTIWYVRRYQREESYM